MLQEVDKVMDFQVGGNELDLINSKFIEDPLPRIENALSKFTFYPV